MKKVRYIIDIHNNSVRTNDGDMTLEEAGLMNETDLSDDLDVIAALYDKYDEEGVEMSFEFLSPETSQVGKRRSRLYTDY